MEIRAKSDRILCDLGVIDSKSNEVSRNQSPHWQIFFKMQLIILKSRPENNRENMQIHRRTKHFNYFLDGDIASLINRLVWWGLQ